MRDYARTLRIVDRLYDWELYERAAEILEQCLARSPGHPEILRRLGRVRLAQGRPREAAGFLEQAVAHDRMMAPLRKERARS